MALPVIFKLASITATSVNDDNGVGSVQDIDNRTYKWVKYVGGAGTVAAVAGQWTYAYAPSGTSAGDGILQTVTSDLSDSNEIGTGVLQSAPATGSYCWVQILGPATQSIALTSGADGDPLTPTGGTDGTLAVTASATSPVCAYADDASAKKIFIACVR